MPPSTRPGAARARRATALATFLAGVSLPSLGGALAQGLAPLVATVPAAAPVTFDVVLPLRDEAGLDALLAAQQDATSPSYHRWLTPAQFATRFGPDAATVSRVTAALQAGGLAVTPFARSLRVSGTADAVGRLLSTRIATARLADGRLRMVAATAPVLPAALSAAGALLPTLDRRAYVMRPFARHFALPAASPANRLGPDGGYYFDDLKQAYAYPSYQTFVNVGGTPKRLDGTGATIGVVIDSQVLPSDLQADFDGEMWSATTGTPDPTLYKYEPVGAGAPAFTTANGDSFEATLDVYEEVTGAPGAHVVLYGIADLSDQSIIAGDMQVVQDNTTDLVSSSFGECELYYTAAYNGGTDFTYLLRLYSQIFKQGNAQGITFLASSGDNAGLECTTTSYAVDGQNGTFIPGVSVPAADPNVTAVGGTNVVTSVTPASLDSSYVAENAWSDPLIPYDQFGIGATVSGGYWGAGGGVSTLFDRPAYQLLTYTAGLTKRTLPDVGMQVGGCPYGIAQLPCNGGDQAIDGNGNTDRSSVILSYAGQLYGVIGTSVSSPEFAGVNALLIEKNGRQGNLNNYIYGLAARQALLGATVPAFAVFHQNIPGYNGVVPSALAYGRYTYNTGNGTPIVTRYLGLPNAAPAGAPQTASNP